MSESYQRGVVCRALRALDAWSVENPVKAGTPDVNYIGGWIELKCLDKWPTRANTIVRVKHFTKEQRICLKRRWHRGGDTWLILKIKKEWLLFTGPVAAKYLGFCTRQELYELALFHWTNGLGKKDLQECLRKATGSWDGFQEGSDFSFAVDGARKRKNKPRRVLERPGPATSPGRRTVGVRPWLLRDGLGSTSNVLYGDADLALRKLKSGGWSTVPATG